MNGIKQDFRSVVIENTSWIHRYVSQKIRNIDLADDLVQEIFIRAFRAYDSYIEEGKLKGWLMRITQNTVRSYFSLRPDDTILSLDAETEEGDCMYHFLSDGITPEEEIMQKELITDIIGAVNRLPNEQKNVFTCRFFNGYSVSETSSILQMPAGSVKSKTYYAIKKIREELGVTPSDSRRRNHIMLCKDAYKYLFMYAKGSLPAERKNEIKEHISGCSECADIVSALEKLIPVMTFAKEDELSHFLINFPDKRLSYCGMGMHMKQSKEINEVLKQNDGFIPKGETWFGNGFSSCNRLLAQFDNEGNEMELEIIPNGETHYKVNIIRMVKIYDPIMWIYDVYMDDGSAYKTKQSLEAPNLYYGTMHNNLGSSMIAKSSLYQAIPGKAKNIRIKRGNGILDCGVYQFAYADSYVTEDERHSLDYSYLLK